MKSNSDIKNYFGICLFFIFLITGLNQSSADEIPAPNEKAFIKDKKILYSKSPDTVDSKTKRLLIGKTADVIIKFSLGGIVWKKADSDNSGKLISNDEWIKTMSIEITYWFLLPDGHEVYVATNSDTVPTVLNTCFLIVYNRKSGDIGFIKDGYSGDPFHGVYNIDNRMWYDKEEIVFKGYSRGNGYLIRYFSHPYFIENDDRTPIIIAAEKGYDNVVTQYIKDGADMNKRTKEGYSALYMAVVKGHFKVVKTLLASGANPDIRGWSGGTALIMAANSGFNDIAIALINVGADIHAVTDKGETAFKLAKDRGHDEMVYILGINGANASTKKNFIMETRIGNINEVKRFIHEGVDVNKKDSPLQMSALSWSAAKGYEEIVKYLISHGADIESKDIRGYTPLMQATNNNKGKIVEYLISIGANLNEKDNRGNTACGRAFKENYPWLAESLKKANAKGCPEDSAKEIEIKSVMKKRLPDYRLLKSPELDKEYLHWLEWDKNKKDVFFHYATGDFDGDKHEDTAAVVQDRYSNSSRKHIAIFLSSRQEKEPVLHEFLGSGIYPVKGGQTFGSPFEEKTLTLERDAIEVIKFESSAYILYLDKHGEFQEYWTSD